MNRESDLLAHRPVTPGDPQPQPPGDPAPPQHPPTPQTPPPVRGQTRAD